MRRVTRKWLDLADADLSAAKLLQLAGAPTYAAARPLRLGA